MRNLQLRIFFHIILFHFSTYLSEIFHGRHDIWIGGQENFFHCDKCECCYVNALKDKQKCVEKAMHHNNCAICFEFLFNSTKDITALPCGHSLHKACLEEMKKHMQYTCPICSKSFCDMSPVWKMLDQEVAMMPMPPMYQNKKVGILCNDCGVNFHLLGHNCPKCSSYNTRQIQGIPVSCFSSMYTT